MSRDISLHKTSLCGRRPSNEDVERYCMNLSINGKAINDNYAPVDLFIICDGHGGKDVAEFIAPELEKHLLRKQLSYPLSSSYIIKVYNYLQKKLVNHPEKIASTCGSTALVLIRYLDKDKNKNIQVINLGDCRAILSRKGLAIPLNKDHKPSWPDEKKRIDEVNKKYGTNEEIKFLDGDIRIGDLSVSRSFGDLDNAPFISWIPDVFHYQLTGDDEYIILACDGVWEVLKNEEAVNFVRDHMDDNHIELYEITDQYPTNETFNQKNIARCLAEYCLAKLSNDNISILIVFLKKF